MQNWKSKLATARQVARKLSYPDREKFLTDRGYTKRRNGVFTKGKEVVVTLKNRDSGHKFKDMHIHTTGMLEQDDHCYPIYDETFRRAV